MANNRISDMSTLDFPMLRELNLNNNNIDQITGLKKLDRLKKLELRGNKLTSTNGIGHAHSLKECFLVQNLKYIEIDNI